MNAILQNLWQQLKSAGPSARWAIGSIVMTMVAAAGLMAYRANNPHFVVLAADLDSAAFNTAITALASTGIRYETTMSGPPYVIQVEEGRKADATAAIHLSGEFLGASRGIASGLDGSSSVFLGQGEREQRTQKRLWEEAEMQLERLNYVTKARVTVSGTTASPLTRTRTDSRRASVVLRLASLALPTATETRALVGIVRGATGVADERITIVDQHSNLLYDGTSAGGADSIIALEERYSTDKTDKVQALLDRTFGPGVAVVGVNGTWKEVREESVSETLDPSKKPRSQRTRTEESPQWPRTIGGPAGVAANTAEGSVAAGRANGVAAEKATTTEEETSYSFGSKTTHTISQPHQLERLSISLVMDVSRTEQLADAEALVKELVGFDEQRGDTMQSRVTELPGLIRDSEGAPVLPDPVEAPEPADPMMRLVLEHGLELLAGAAFLFVMLRSLKSARASTTGAASRGETVDAQGRPVPASKANAAGGAAEDDEVDLDALARAHVEELLKTEPEKVSALLSRWALSEDMYAQTGAR